MSFSLIIDLIVIALLGATILYALRLNKQLTMLYNARGDLQTFIEGFTNSLSKAETSMASLRSTGETTFAAVHEALNQAQVLKDDLSYLVERGEGIASSLDDSIRAARALQKEIENLKFEPTTPMVNEDEKNNLINHLRSVR